jgi:hypothetical protein
MPESVLRVSVRGTVPVQSRSSMFKLQKSKQKSDDNERLCCFKFGRRSSSNGRMHTREDRIHQAKKVKTGIFCS